MRNMKMIAICLSLLIITAGIAFSFYHANNTNSCASENKGYSYANQETSSYAIKENLIFLEKLITGETALIYGIPTIAPSQPLACVNYSRLLLPKDLELKCNGPETIWSNKTHKICLCNPHFKSLIDIDGNLVSPIGYHNIEFFNGYIIAGDGAGRNIIDQWGNTIPKTDFVEYDDGLESIFGLIIGNNGFIGPDDLNPGQFNIIANSHNSWFEN